MEVQEIMTMRPISIGPEETAAAAARLLRRTNLGAVPVCDAAGRLRGMVTDRDIVTRCLGLEYDPDTTRVTEIMSRAVTSVAPGADVREAAEIMAKKQIRRLPVTRGGRLVGMLTLCDLARREDCRAECARAMESISAQVHID